MTNKRKRTQINDYQAEVKLFASRALIAFIGIIVLIGILVINLFNIQINEFQNYKTRSNDNRIKIIPIAPNRGLIYDRNYKLLAENRPVFNLEITPDQVENLTETLETLQEILPVTQDDIDDFNKERYRTRRFKSVPLLTQLTQKQVAIFSVNQYKFIGVEVKAYLKRNYPYGKSLTHTLGYVAKINDKDLQRLDEEGKSINYQATRDIGKLGIERYYEDILHGTAGYEEVEVNSRGKVVRVLKSVPPIAGQDLVLNLDIELQQFVEKQFDGRKGSAVVLNPKNNEVLAMVSSPSYNPNLFVNGISSKAYNALLNNPDRPLVNRVTLGIYPPASTVKPFIAVVALQEGVVTPNTTRNDPGYWRIPNSKTLPFRDWKRWGHGEINLKQALEESVDTFFYQIAFDLGIDRLAPWMKKFGFGSYTGIDIHEESKANMPTREWKRERFKQPWYQGDTIPVGIGQGYWTATPIQIAKATSILVNRGKVIPPHLLNSIIDNGKQEIQTLESYPAIKGIPDNYWQLAIDGMVLVNNGTKGTARSVFENTPYVSAGKSGSAQVFGLKGAEYDADNVAEHLRDHALFTSFAPVDDPKIVVSLVLENGGGGSSQGGPIARKVLDYVLIPKKEKGQQEKK